jgi:O-antigen/teichoic acid export membrane protein
MTETSKNYIYTSGYQLLLIALPLITVPYVTRVIGAEGLGIYAYTYSIIQFFILFIMLGVNNYGCRTIAKNRTEKHILTEKFWEIYKLQFLLGILMISLLFIYILFSTIEYKLVLILQILNLLAAIFDINWFFFGIEKFKLTVYRNAIIKIIALLCIFIFVKTNSDLWIYTVIISGSMLLSQLILFIFLFKHISYVNTSVKDIAKHIKPNLILFLPVIATSIYMIGSKIILADLTTMTQLGYYDNVEKLKNVSMGLISSLGIVMLPRISNMIENGEIEKIKQFNNISIKFVMFISFALAFGLAAISEELIPVFLGPEFKTCILLLKFLVVTIIIA